MPDGENISMPTRERLSPWNTLADYNIQNGTTLYAGWRYPKTIFSGLIIGEVFLWILMYQIQLKISKIISTLWKKSFLNNNG